MDVMSTKHSTKKAMRFLNVCFIVIPSLCKIETALELAERDVVEDNGEGNHADTD